VFEAGMVVPSESRLATDMLASRRGRSGSAAMFGLIREYREPQSSRLSGGGLTRFGDELLLDLDVVATDVANLPHLDHRHRLVLCRRPSSRPEAAKTKPWKN